MTTFTFANKKISHRPFSIQKSKWLLIIISLSLAFASTTYGQDPLKNATAGSSIDTLENTKATEDSKTVVNVVPAAFPGAKTEWLRYLARNVVIPEEMRGAKFSRTIVVKFTVDEKGRLKNFEDAGNDVLKKEAIRVVKGSGKWIPAYSNSKPIASECERSITFQWN
jgi:hypothetical protein